MRPQKLYKYEAFNSQAIENLKSHRIYFSSPLGFNDPYDCTTNPIVLTPSIEEVEKIRAHYLKNSASDAIIQTFEHLSNQELQEMLQSVGTAALGSAVERFVKERGVSCFSERNDNLLMWGHYGGRYKGFVLEFSTQHEPFNRAEKVEYVETVPKANITPYLIGAEMEAAKDIFRIKSSAWSYEKEWRIFHQTVGTLYYYEPSTLTGIYFGPESTEESIEIIALIIRGQNPNVKLYRGKRSRTEFQIIFDEFQYISHIEAKNLGLI